jgi:uncharacterized membrane protein YesL
MSMHDGPHGTDLPPAAPPPLSAPDRPAASDRVDLGGYLNRAWELFTANAGLLVGGFAILAIILAVSLLTVIGFFVLLGPLTAGYYGMIQKLRDGRDTEFGELFAGFQDFARTCIAGLFVAVGWVIPSMVALILFNSPCLGPLLATAGYVAVGVVTAAATMFVLPAVVLSPRAPVDALRDNVGFAQRFVTPALLFAAVFVGLGLVGGVACGIGLLVTGPLASAFVMEAYHDYYRPRASD